MKMKDSYEKKKLFGVIPYIETPDGDRLTRESAVRTVHVGMGLGLIAVLTIISQVYPWVASELGASLGYGFVAAMLLSWTVSSYLAHDTVVEKVVSIFKDQGEYIE